MFDIAIECLVKITDFILNLTTEQVTLLSVLVTIFIFTTTKISEHRLEKRKLRKENYEKFLSFNEKVLHSIKDKNKKIMPSHKEFSEMGRMLMLYGSKKVYRHYLCYREFNTNQITQKYAQKYPGLNLVIFALINMQIRKEIKISSFQNLRIEEILGYFINDINNNPVASTEYTKLKIIYRIMIIECKFFEWSVNFGALKSFFYNFIYPVIKIIGLTLTYTIQIPLGRIMLRLLPNYSKNMLKK